MKPIWIRPLTSLNRYHAQIDTAGDKRVVACGREFFGNVEIVKSPRLAQQCSLCLSKLQRARRRKGGA